MKKIIIFLMLTVLVSCGPSKAELEAQAAAKVAEIEAQAKAAQDVDDTKSDIQVTDKRVIRFERADIELKVVKVKGSSILLIQDYNGAISTYKLE